MFWGWAVVYFVRMCCLWGLGMLRIDSHMLGKGYKCIYLSQVVNPSENYLADKRFLEVQPVKLLSAKCHLKSSPRHAILTIQESQTHSDTSQPLHQE